MESEGPKPRLDVRNRLLHPPFQQAPGAGAAEGLAAVDLVPAHLLDGGEIVIFAIKPSLWYILFSCIRWLIGMALIFVLADWFAERFTFLSPSVIARGALLLAGARLCIASLQWVSRLYVLTNRRIMRLRGIFNVDLFECPLTKIQNTYLSIAWHERLVGTGTISFAGAPTGGIVAVWTMVDHPVEIHERVRSAIHRAQFGNGN